MRFKPAHFKEANSSEYSYERRKHKHHRPQEIGGHAASIWRVRAIHLPQQEVHEGSRHFHREEAVERSGHIPEREGAPEET